MLSERVFDLGENPHSLKLPGQLQTGTLVLSVNPFFPQGAYQCSDGIKAEACVEEVALGMSSDRTAFGRTGYQNVQPRTREA